MNKLGPVNQEVPGIQKSEEEILRELVVANEKISQLEVDKEKLVDENARLKKENEKLSELASKDSLTGLHTRRYFEEETEKYIDNYRKFNSPEGNRRKKSIESGDLSVFMCDIDSFKKINDTFGHDFGDKILVRVGEIIRSQIRNNDIVCRWGGEEILVSLPGASGEVAAKKAEEIRALVCKIADEFKEKYPEFARIKELETSVSIGVASFGEGLDLGSTVKLADKSMYKAKEAGKNRVVVWTPEV